MNNPYTVNLIYGLFSRNKIKNVIAHYFASQRDVVDGRIGPPPPYILIVNMVDGEMIFVNIDFCQIITFSKDWIGGK